MLRLFNTLTREREEVTPSDGRVKMYSCGPTVYRPIHIGNLRSFLLADFLGRALSYSGMDPYRVMNITDVGHMTDELSDLGRDKMLLAASDEGLGTSEIAEKYTEAFFANIDAVNIRPADVYPKASDHIPQIVELIAKLIERGHAYEVDGSVYFDVTTFPGYGRLSGQALEDMRPGHRVGEVNTVKRHHQDFTLWVAAGPRRELVFPSPWGTGYPGWHIECSAMSLHYLGERFDIHTAGIDLRFPHHEDEIAQSEGALGHEVVRIWVHGEHLLTAQAKMAKSSGNVVTISDVAEQGYDPLAFRYLCLTARYRRQVHFTTEALEASATALRRLREQISLLGPPGVAPITDAEVRASVRDERALAHQDRFVSAVHDDLDLPSALRVLHEALGDEQVQPGVRGQLAASWDEVLGLDLLRSGDLAAEHAAMVHERERARAGGDFARADALRDRLRAEGIELLDGPDGTRWVRR